MRRIDRSKRGAGEEMMRRNPTVGRRGFAFLLTTTSRIRGSGRIGVTLMAIIITAGLATVAFAGDDLTVDGDLVDTTQANPVSITLSSGGSTSKTARFTLTCKTKQHVDAGDTVTLTFDSGASAIPSGGTLSAGNGSIVRPSGWPADTVDCATPAQTVSSGGTLPFTGNDSTVSITAPTAAGTYTYKAVWNIGGTGEANDVASSKVTAQYDVTVPANSAPTTPGTPTASANPNRGSFSLNWTASTDTDPITYTLEHKNSSAGAIYAPVTTTTSASYTFGGSNPEEGSGTWTYRVQASDGTLSSAFSPESAGIKVDKQGPSAPTASANHGPEYDSTPATDQSDDWYKDSVSISFAGSTDPALADGSAGSGVASYTAAQLVNTQGPFTKSGKATDGAGNDSASTSFSGNVDTANPVSVASANGGAYSSDTWTNQTVNVSLSATDTGGSGVKQIVYSIDGGADVTTSGSSVAIPAFTTSGIHTVSFHAVDNVDNTESPNHSFVVKVDKTAPTVACGSADGLWHNDNVSIGCTASDGGSGLADSGDAGFSLSTTVDPGNETATASTGSRTVFDKAGNSTTGGPITNNKIDRNDPASLASATKGSPATSYTSDTWTNQTVTLTLSASDGGSGVKSIVYTINGGAAVTESSASKVLTFASDGEFTVSFHAVDNVDNTESPNHSFVVKVDKTAPTVACGSADGLWHNDNVSIGCTASDGGSGLADSGDAGFSLSTTVDTGNETATASTGSRTVFDKAGNSTTGGPITNNKIDRNDPASLASATKGSPATSYTSDTWTNQTVTLTLSASDGGSGVKSIVYTINGGAAVTESSASKVLTFASDGEFTVSFHAVDNVDNTESPNHSFVVKVDKTAPTVACGSADGLWHNDNVS